MKKIILDCDPGHDDAMAILLAHGNPEIELLAITTVAGNQTLDKTSLNARRVCTVAGIRDVPVAAVIAPAGYGKTTLLSEWAEHDDRPFAWVTVDGDEPDRFSYAVEQALEEVDPLAARPQGRRVH